MKILVICQHYKPEPFRISDICEALVDRGHEVTVITGTPNYPMGEIYDGYQNGNRQDEIINGVKVHRCKIHPRKSGSIHRLWNYYSYPMASKKYIKTLDGSYDVVFINQLSPVMMAQAGIKYAKKWNKKAVLYCLDLWPASLTAGGVNSGMIYKWFLRTSKKVYSSVDKILITSKSFADYFRDTFGITDTTYLPQYAEDEFTPEQCRKEPDEYIDLMFAGNLGAAQSVKTIIEAARRTQDLRRVRYHIVGDGSEYENLKKQAEGLENVIFYGRKPMEEMPKYYAMADAMLVTMQKDPVLSLTLPGKVQSYMAAGKPIIGAIDGEASCIIGEAQCGVCGEAENAELLADNIRRVINMNKAILGQNAKEYYDKHFNKRMFADRLEARLEKIKERSYESVND